jgi:hypothetical protein
MNFSFYRKEFLNNSNMETICSDEQIEAWDVETGESRTVFNENLDEKWLSERITINSKFKHRYNITEHYLAELLISVGDLSIFNSFKHIYLCYQLSDFPKIIEDNYDKEYRVSNQYQDILHYQEFWTDKVGLFVYDKQLILINVALIEKEFKDSVTSRNDILREILVSIFHELSHSIIDMNNFVGLPHIDSAEEEVSCEEFGILMTNLVFKLRENKEILLNSLYDDIRNKINKNKLNSSSDPYCKAYCDGYHDALLEILDFLKIPHIEEYSQ